MKDFYRENYFKKTFRAITENLDKWKKNLCLRITKIYVVKMEYVFCNPYVCHELKR